MKIPFRDTWPDASLATGLTEGIRFRVIRFRVIRMCAICDRRPGELSVVIEGNVWECCGTCWEQAADEGTLTRETTK